MKRKNLREARELQRKNENRRSILKAAEKILAEQGYGLASVDEIAEEAQFSKATIYRYFKSKSEIFVEIIMNSFLEARKNYKKIQLTSKSAEEKLWELINYTLAFYQKKMNMTRIFFMEKSTMKKVLNLDIDSHIMASDKRVGIPEDYLLIADEIFDIICEIIQQGIDSGQFRKMDAKEAGFMLRAMLRGFHFRGYTTSKTYSLKKSTELLHSFLLNGIKIRS